MIHNDVHDSFGFYGKGISNYFFGLTYEQFGKFSEAFRIANQECFGAANIQATLARAAEDLIITKDALRTGAVAFGDISRLPPDTPAARALDQLIELPPQKINEALWQVSSYIRLTAFEDDGAPRSVMTFKGNNKSLTEVFAPYEGMRFYRAMKPHVPERMDHLKIVHMPNMNFRGFDGPGD